MKGSHHLRFHKEHQHLGSPFGTDAFGRAAERVARFLGRAPYLIAQTMIVLAWIMFNSLALVSSDFDPYPFILLNLAFSLQAAFAAPLILLAQTRQAERDKMWSEADAKHRESLSESTLTLLQQNTDITERVRILSEEVANLTREIHQRVASSN